MQSSSENPTENSLDESISAENSIGNSSDESIYAQDAGWLVQLVEDTHPCFAIDEVPEGYETARENYLNQASILTDTVEFRFATQAYLASLHDGHTGVASGGTLYQALDLSCVAEGDSLYLTKDNKLTGETITSVGGLDIAEIFRTVDTYCVAENQSACDLNHTYYALSREYLQRAGVQETADGQVELTV